MASLEEGAFVLLRKLSYHTKAVSFAGLYKCNSILAKVFPIPPSKGIYVEKKKILNTRALQSNVQLLWNSIK